MDKEKIKYFTNNNIIVLPITITYYQLDTKMYISFVIGNAYLLNFTILKPFNHKIIGYYYLKLYNIHIKNTYFNT